MALFLYFIFLLGAENRIRPRGGECSRRDNERRGRCSNWFPIHQLPGRAVADAVGGCSYFGFGGDEGVSIGSPSFLPS